MSSHGSDGPQLVPQGTSGVLGAGLLAASFGGGVPINNAVERLKTELIPASMLVLESVMVFLLTIIGSVSVGGGGGMLDFGRLLYSNYSWLRGKQYFT